MNVYFSGISGTGIGPLAELAHSMGMKVFGSDRAEGDITKELQDKGIEVFIGTQDGKFLREKYENEGIDWFVHTSALPEGHPEIELARKLGIKVSKRDDFIEHLIDIYNLKMVAVAGTHGKTTTTSMIIWACKELGIPISYTVGTTLPWAAASNYAGEGSVFVYEADEFDRNFLKFHPWLSVITTETYDHADIYNTPEEYHAAFAQFRAQSENVITIDDAMPASGLDLVGELRRHDAKLAASAVSMIVFKSESAHSISPEDIIAVLNKFPGAGRRFEQVTPGVFTDYAHHPNEVAATIKMAQELIHKDGYKGLAVVYEPYQNKRQHQVLPMYENLFAAVDKLFWLPTYLLREENTTDHIIEPAEFIATLKNKEIAEPAQLNDELAQKLQTLHNQNYLILLMAGGTADEWLRDRSGLRK